MSLDAYPLVSDWLRWDRGQLTVRTGKVDIGQRISSALAQAVADELLLPAERVSVERATTRDGPDEGMTSGSNSIRQSGEAARHAAATLRVLAQDAVARRHGGLPEAWTLTPDGFTGAARNRPIPLSDVFDTLDFSQMVDRTAPSLPRTSLPRAPMRGLREIVSGEFRFLHDLEFDGMLHARVVRPPHVHGRLDRIPVGEVEALAGRGIKVVRDGSFVAVTSDSEWQAVRAAGRINRVAEWETGTDLATEPASAILNTGRAIRLAILGGAPAPDQALPDPPVDAEYHQRYERPFTLHGPLAPSAALAEWDGERLTVTTHSQGIYPLRQSIAESLGLGLGQVNLIHHPGSGCYGHNGADDAAFEAALIATMVPGRPVLLKWTREEENRWAPCGTAQAVEIRATMDGDRIARMHLGATGGTYRGRPRPGPDQAGPAKLLANRYRKDATAAPAATPNMNREGGLHRNLTPIYQIPQIDCVKTLLPDLPLRTSALRCLGAAVNVFGLESLIDEICRSRGLDPFAFRKAHLDDARAIAVLDRLHSELRPPAEGTGRGIAFARYKNEMAYVGVAVDLRVSDAAEITLERIVIAADAGRIIDGDGTGAQLEGGALHAASWALHEEVDWGPEGITSCDWESYPVLRFGSVPEIAVALIDHPDLPALGVGEAAPGPTLAAIANAVCDATGLRLRRLPLTADALRRAAISG